MRVSCIYKDKPLTFRRSSTKILPERNRKNVGWGTNLQNWEESLREVIIPDGFSAPLTEKCLYWLDTQDTSVFTEEELMSLRVLSQTDQSGAEALIVAYDCTAGDYRQLFIHGVKPHTYVALKLFKDVWKQKAKEHNVSIESDTIDILCETPIEQLKANPFWREINLLILDSDNWPLTERFYYLAKQTVHSSNYGIMWHTFIMNVLEKSGGKIVISKEDGSLFLSTVRELFPEIPERNERVSRQVRETGMLFNMFGHPYIVWNGRPPEQLLSDMKKFFAWGPQSTVAEITRTAYTNLYNYAAENNCSWDILADTHDSYLVQCPLLDSAACSRKQAEFMGQEFTSPVDGAVFRMRSETRFGFNWSKYKKGKNNLGLREMKFI